MGPCLPPQAFVAQAFAHQDIKTETCCQWQIVVRRSRQLVKTFRGQNQERFVIRSALGGIDQSFVISGSEDSQVYIWHRQTARLLGRLEGHSRTVNAVCWSPIDPCAARRPSPLPGPPATSQAVMHGVTVTLHGDRYAIHGDRYAALPLRCLRGLCDSSTCSSVT